MNGDVTGGKPAAGVADFIGRPDPIELDALRHQAAQRYRRSRWIAWVGAVVFGPCFVISFFEIGLPSFGDSWDPSVFWPIVMLVSMLGFMNSIAPLNQSSWFQRPKPKSGAFAIFASAYAQRQAALLVAWRKIHPGCDPTAISSMKSRGPRSGWIRDTNDTWHFRRMKIGLTFASRRSGELISIPQCFAIDDGIDAARLAEWAKSLGLTHLDWQGRSYDTSSFGLASLFAHAAGLGVVVPVVGGSGTVYRLDTARADAVTMGQSPGNGFAVSTGPDAPPPAAKSPTLAGNVAATVAGTAVAIIVQIACLPMQIEALGLAAWGVLGLQAIVQGVVLTLDLGLGSVVGRELARLSHAMTGDDAEKSAEASREARNLVRTLELGYWLVGLLAAAGIWVAAPWLAAHWVAQGSAAAHEAHALPPEQVERSLRAMGIVAGMLLPGGLYTAVLAGLQRQIGAQILRMGWSFAINVGAVVAVRMTGAGLDAFFAVQLATTFAWTIASAGLCWYRLPGAERPRWQPEAFARLWRFAAGMAVITVAGTVLVQIDKVALSYLVPLELAGGYFVAYTIGTTPLLLVKPLFAVIFPRLTRSVATPGADVSGDFHRNAQIMAALVLPLAGVVATFGVPLVQAWTRNPDTAALAGPLAGLLIIGTALHALMHVPYALQLAHGWVRVSVHILAVVLSVMIPLMTVLVWRFSVTGAALGWLIMHALQLTLCVAATHGRLLPGERLRWLLKDFAIPLAVAVALAWTGKIVLAHVAPTLLAPEGNRLLSFAAMAVVGLVAQLGTVLACDQLFGAVRQRLRSLAGPD